MKLFALPLFLLAAAVPLGAADVALRAGAAQADITPEPEVLNWITGKPYGEIADRLCVHVLVLDDGATRAAVVRWDLVDVSESARDEVRKALHSTCGIPSENILVNASHNHSAPWAPVYGGDYRGKERDTWWAVRYMPAQNNFPPFRRWMDRLISATTTAAQEATAALRPVGLTITRVAAYDYLHNRRPRAPRWGITDPKPIPVVTPASKKWQPEVLQGGASFGPLDRTLTLVGLREPSGKVVASLFHLACHAVSIYPTDTRISADWPGPASRAIAEAIGGEVLFLQGCTGDINPWRRGAAAVAEMAVGLRQKVELALPYQVGLKPEPIRVGRTTLKLPLTPAAQKRVGAETVEAEIQVLVCGPLALVALPGEPMTELNLFIRERSPFPQTLVLGYSNGNGAHYVGMPGEKARGGYEATDAGAGTDECGRLMVEAAVKVLEDLYRQRTAK
jgi:hypothetical protein